jgi:glycosyltransferase involved in cell wall biosynthesis
VTRSLDILLVNWNDRTNPHAGGAEIHLHEIFGRLVAQGHRVTLLCSGYGKADRSDSLDGIRVLRVGGRYDFNFVLPLELRKLLRRERFDVLVEALNKIPLCTPLFAGLPVLGIGHHLFGSTIFREVPPPLSLYVYLSELALPWVYRKVRMEVISESTKEDFLARGLAPARLKVVHVGIDRARYTPGGAKDEKPSLLAFGRIRKYKRLDLVVDAVAELARTRWPDLTLTIGGSGNYLEGLRRHVRKTKAEPWVRFAGGVSEQEKVRLYQRAWALVVTSPKEGWGLTCLEAAACGTPVIASNSPGLREAVKDGVSGLLVRHGERKALEDAMARILEDGELRRRLGAGALAFAGGFSWERAAGETFEMIEETIRDWAGRP